MDNDDLLCMLCGSLCSTTNFIWLGGKRHIHGTARPLQKDMDYWEQRKHDFLLAQYSSLSEQSPKPPCTPPYILGLGTCIPLLGLAITV